VRAFNEAGASDPSTAVDVTTGPTPPAVPAAPTGLEVTSVQTTEVRISWVDASTNETQFRVERAAGGSSAFAEIAILPANSTSFTDSVSYDTPLQYRVRASNGAGSSGYSNIASTRSLVSFSQQLYPILSSVTCSGSGCHNATAAQGGLTMNGSVDATYAEVHDELSPVWQIPRVDTATPCDSLLLKKASRRTCDDRVSNHSGGTVWETASAAYQIALRWIGQGAAKN
jgi:hypothetical protein